MKIYLSVMNIIPTPNFDQINPSECISGKIKKLDRLINSIYQKKFTPFGLKGSIISILFIIGKIPGINQMKIANSLILDSSTVSRDVKKLELKGWIEITKGKDSRTSELKLTKKGCEIIEEITPLWNEIHIKVETILGSFSINQIDNITHAIKENIDSLK